MGVAGDSSRVLFQCSPLLKVLHITQKRSPMIEAITAGDIISSPGQRVVILMYVALLAPLFLE